MVHSRIKEAAIAAGRAVPHLMLYANTVYNWPFNAEQRLGAAEIDLLDIHGVPHAEQCDPGLYPSYFWDHGRQSGRDAFLSTFRNYIANASTATDGVMLDAFDTNPVSCRRKDGKCFATRDSPDDASEI